MGKDKRSKEEKRSRSRSKDDKKKSKKDKHKKRSNSKEQKEQQRPKRKSNFDVGPQEVAINTLLNQAQTLYQNISNPNINPSLIPQQQKLDQNVLFETGIIQINTNTGQDSTEKKELPEFTIINPNLVKGNTNQEDPNQVHNSILAKANITINPQPQQGASQPDVLSFINPMTNMLNPLTTLNPLNQLNPYTTFHPTLSILNDTAKLKRKIYVPDQFFNYTGLIIGPKGANQKRLEEETGCKILVRGRGSQKEGMPPQPDDNEPQHVLIVGDTEANISKAAAEIERIVFADEETRNKIRQEQLKIVAQLKNDPSALQQPQILNNNNNGIDLSLTTPYGPPSSDAYIIPVPNDCVGLVIGKGGETIKLLQVQSGARKVQVAADSAPGSNTRNVFVEGEKDSIERVKKMLQDIVETQQKMKQSQMATGSKMIPMTIPGNLKEDFSIPDNMVGLVIGRGGETIKNIHHKTGAFVYIPKECEPGSTERVLTISGKQQQILQAKDEIMQVIEAGQSQLQNVQRFQQQDMYKQSYGAQQFISQMQQGQIPPPPMVQPTLHPQSSIQFQNEAALLQQQQQFAQQQQPNIFPQQQMHMDPMSAYYQQQNMQPMDPSQIYYYQQLYAQQQQPQIIETIIQDDHQDN